MDKQEKLEVYFNEEHSYCTAINQLRTIILKTELEETYKWSFPTYTFKGKNVLAICKFKAHFGIWFFKGVFLSDPLKVLENAQEGKTQAMRHWKFNSIEEIKALKISAYVNEAIEIQKKGLKLASKTETKRISILIPSILKTAFKESIELESAFNQLTYSQKKEYAEYIATAKQKNTKETRLAKIKPLILQHKGLNAKYR